VTCDLGALMDDAHGFLGEPESARLREHVSGCPACRKALDRIEGEKQLLREAAAGLAGLPLKPASPAETRARSELHTGRMLTMAASILLCAGVSWMLLHSPAAGPDQDVASKAQGANELPPGLRKALPGIEERLAGKPDGDWTGEFLIATEFSDNGLPKVAGLQKEDLSALVGRAYHGAPNPQDQKRVADRTEQWGLRLTQFVSAREALQGVHGYVDVEDTSLKDLLNLILTKHGVSYVIDAAAKKGGAQGGVSMKMYDLPAASALALLLQPRRMDHAPLESLVVITPSGKVWRATAPTQDETRTIELRLKDLVSSDAAAQSKAYEDLVTLGPPALEPLMGALGTLEGKAAERVRTVCRKIAWDHGNLWLVDLPSGADLQKLSGPQRKLLDTRINCETGGMELEDFLKSQGLKVSMKAKPVGPFAASVKAEPLASLLKAVTRSADLDFYLEGETIVIDTTDNVRAAVEQ